MSNALNKAGLKLFTRYLEHYTPADPLYEEYVDKRGRTKRRKVRRHYPTSYIVPPSRSLPAVVPPILSISNADFSPHTQRQLPPGLSDRDAAILRSVKRRAHHLDKGFSLCGLHFGWAFIIGSHPISSTPTHRRLSPEPSSQLYLPLTCAFLWRTQQVLSPASVTRRMPYSATSWSSAKPVEPSMCPPHHSPSVPTTALSHCALPFSLSPPSPSPFFSRIPAWLTQRMLLNLAIATSVGLVPIVGDVILAAFRANSRNAMLLEEFLRHRMEDVTRTGGESSAPAERGISLRDKPRATTHEAGQDIDDGVMAPLERKRSRPGTGGADNKGASTSALPEEGPQTARNRDSRFVEDVN